MISLILFPSSYFDSTRVDEALQEEYSAAMNTGLFRPCFFDFDKWFYQGTFKLVGAPDKPSKAIYRGWMMQPEQYRTLYLELLKTNVELITKPDEYEMMHIFPNVYELIKPDTAGMRLYPLYAHIDVEELKKNYGRFMVKDYVKSVKGTDFPKFFDSAIDQTTFDCWMDKFYQYRKILVR